MKLIVSFKLDVGNKLTSEEIEWLPKFVEMLAIFQEQQKLFIEDLSVKWLDNDDTPST